MFLRKSIRVVAAAAALALAVAAPVAAEPDDENDSLGSSIGEDAAIGEEPTTGDDANDGEELPTDDAGDLGEDADAADDVDDEGDGAEFGTFALPTDPVTIQIANITDFHGRIDGPAVRLACYMEDNSDVILTASGDNVGATPFISSAQGDYPTIDVLNAVGLKVSALGNHELDRGWAVFDDQAVVMNYKNLAINMQGGNSATSVGDYEIVTVDGINIAFIGAVTEELPSLITPSILDGVTLNPVAASINAKADALRVSGEADVIVALVHEDITSFAGDLVGVDLAFGGHTHVRYNNESDVPLLAMQSIQYGEAISEVRMTVNPDGSVKFDSAEVLGLGSAQGSSPVYRNDCTGAISGEVRTIVADAKAEAAAIGAQPLGYISGDFNRAQGIDPVTSERQENRGEESTVGNMVADAQLWAVQQTEQYADTELAFMNPGGLRTDLKYAYSAESPGDADGLVTLGEAAAMQPFANTLFAVTMTGQDVLDVLNEQKQPATSSRTYLKLGVAGLTYEYDPDTLAVTQVWLDSGREFDLGATYRVVVNSFLQAGGDNFTSIKNATNVNDTGIIDLDSFVDFMEANAPETSPLDPVGVDYGFQRSWGFADVSEVSSDDIESGQEIALEYAGLWFTTGEASNAENLTVYFDGELLGTFPVTGDNEDLKIKQTNYGRASVTVHVPDLSVYEGNTEVAFAVYAGQQLLTDWIYDVEGVGTETDEPTTDPTGPTDTDKPTTPETDAPTTPGGKTPDTGADVGGPLIAGMLLLGTGAVFLGIRRRMLT